MAENTKIEWTNHSASPWEGCTKVSEGCANCYAAARDGRHLHEKQTHWGKGAPRWKTRGFAAKVRKLNREAIEFAVCSYGFSGTVPFESSRCPQCDSTERIHYRRPSVFPSLCDWLDDEVPIEWLAEFLQLIHETPNLDWLLLTKRPENWRERIVKAAEHMAFSGGFSSGRMVSDWWYHGVAPANVWIGTSVENQRTADLRIPELLKIPAKMRFLSLEPLLGPVDLQLGHLGKPGLVYSRHDDLTDGIDWLIIGGESGNGARPCNVDWIRSLVQQGKDAGVPVFVKQLGAKPQISITGRPKREHFFVITHPKGGDPSDWPEDLRVRQFPEVSAENAE